MLTVAPLSVLLIGLLGMLIVAFSVARMTVLERKIHLAGAPEPARRPFVTSGV